MTRESIPRFDLYGELEVSRSATVEVIEAAYRALVKHHHPDVALPSDRERITRLNLAREWLTDPSRRWRYDAATDPDPRRRMHPASSGGTSAGPESWSTTVSPQPSRSTARPADARPTRDAATRTPPAGTAGATGAPRARTPEEIWAETVPLEAAPSSFGINSAEIRQFLADLRALDTARAMEVLTGKDTADAARYADARKAALNASRRGRHNQWAFAREAAQVIAKGKLGGTPEAFEIATIVADIAGAIAVRDLITRAEFELLLLPWRWRPAPETPQAGTEAASRNRRGGRRPSVSRPSLKRPSLPRPSLSVPGLARASQGDVAGPGSQNDAHRNLPRRELSRHDLPRDDLPRDELPRPGLSRLGLPRLSVPGLPGFSLPWLPGPHGRARTDGWGSPLTRVHGSRPSAMTLASSSPVLVAFVVVAIVAGGFAILNQPAPAPIIAVGGETALPTLRATPIVATPIVRPTSPPAITAPPAIDPAQLEALQEGAARTIRDLIDISSTGNVEAARPFLGDTAPDLRPSGLSRATFPDVAATDIRVARVGVGFTAIAGADRLTSIDGQSWTFDYGDRPLAVFGQSAERDLYWNEPNGRHDLFLRAASATITKSGLSVRFAWQYRPDRPEDPYFRDATISISSLTLGTRSVPLPTEPGATIDPAVRSAVLTVAGPVKVPPQILVQVTISPRLGAGGGTTVRSISTLFELRPI